MDTGNQDAVHVPPVDSPVVPASVRTPQDDLRDISAALGVIESCTARLYVAACDELMGAGPRAELRMIRIQTEGAHRSFVRLVELWPKR